MPEMKAKDSFFTSENGQVRAGEKFNASAMRAQELANRGLAEETGPGVEEIDSGLLAPPRMRDGSFVAGGVGQPRVIGPTGAQPAGLNTDEGAGMVEVPPSPSAAGVVAVRQIERETATAREASREAVRAAREAERAEAGAKRSQGEKQALDAAQEAEERALEVPAQAAEKLAQEARRVAQEAERVAREGNREAAKEAREADKADKGGAKAAEPRPAAPAPAKTK